MDFPILNGLDAELRREVLAAARLRRFARGEIVFHEGDPGDTFHLVAKGRFAVRISTELGETATLAVLGQGDFFGELALVGENPRTATITALEASETMALHRESFQELRATYPPVQAFLVEVLGTQVGRLSDQVVEALYAPAEKRVLRRLGDLAEIYSAGEGTPTQIPMTQDDIATMAGTSRATVNRVLGEAEQAGLIAVGRRRVTVLDAAGLATRGR
jgi:CRP/FNR family transcriptional regulator, cyclic AMP receptor protein